MKTEPKFYNGDLYNCDGGTFGKVGALDLMAEIAVDDVEDKHGLRNVEGNGLG